MSYFVSNFYVFQKIRDVSEFARQLDLRRNSGLSALIILAEEGINASLSSTDLKTLEDYEAQVLELLNLQLASISQAETPTSVPELWTRDNVRIKTSRSHIQPLSEFVVKIRPEIVTLGRPDLDISKQWRHPSQHLSPKEWHEALQDPDTLVVDTRNWYEYEIGTFRGALNPNIEQFTEFSSFARENLPKNKRILIFCTGGIRCEKGIFDLQEQGFQNVQQLEGGILNYLEAFPDGGAFQGECFVFDQRVAVQPNLEPSETYRFCPHCGQPARRVVECARCGQTTRICNRCHKNEVLGLTCSKNCAHHYSLHPGKKGARQIPAWLQSEKQERKASVDNRSK
ncbi:MAG: rhodanese-like domain-containing protein [Bdellovibrio sp.]